MKRTLIGAAFIALTAVACNTKIETPEVYGELSVSLAGEPVVEVISKAVETLEQTDPEAENYMVRIYDSADAEMYESVYSAFETQRLALGTYYVTAENCTESEAEEGNGKMRLYGRSEDVTLTADQLVKTATVNCTVSNAKVSVQFDESVQGRFSALQVSLSGGTSRTSAITIAQTAAGVVTETWFNPSDLAYTITGTFTGSGMNKPVNVSRTIPLQARNNIILLVKVNLENGQLMPSVTFDTQIDDPTEVPGEFNPYI